MAPRLKLHQILKEITDNVYFQPPNNSQIKYPCIVYRRDSMDTKFADDKPYNHMIRYTVTVIDRDPDSDIPVEVSSIPRSRYDRGFTADQLNHDVFNIFF